MADLSWNPHVHCHVHNSLPLNPTLATSPSNPQVSIKVGGANTLKTELNIPLCMVFLEKLFKTSLAIAERNPKCQHRIHKSCPEPAELSPQHHVTNI